MLTRMTISTPTMMKVRDISQLLVPMPAKTAHFCEKSIATA